MNSNKISHIRTITPVVIGYAIVIAARQFDIVLDEDTTATMSLTIAGSFTAIYYATVRRLGKKWPAVEKLLGARATPEYR